MSATKIKLKPTGIYRENMRSFYTVKYNDDEYNVKMWKFQVDRGGLPEEIDCVVKEENNGQIRITQDLATITNELYKVGQTYRFRIRQKYKDFYSVIEPNGLIFRLTDYGNVRLFEGQSISAEVISISPGLTCLRLKSENPDAKIPFMTIEELCDTLGLDEEQSQLVKELSQTNSFEESRQLYNSQDGKWVLDAALHIDQMLMSSDEMDTKQGLKFVEIFDRLCHYILEESDMLKNMDDDERRIMLNSLTVMAQHVEDYREAFMILDNGTERRYILKQLKNLEQSGNLYQPERKFRIIMSIFGMREELMTELMPRIFEIILGGNKEHWQTEPFRTAFVDMLELFVTEYRHKAMRNSATGLIPKLITAIAIQQLLSNGEDNIDRRLNHTTLLRLLACLQHYASESILDDALYSLFTPYDSDIQYDWKAIELLDTLYMKAAYNLHHPDKRKMSPQRYATDKVELIITPQSILLQPVTGRPKSVMPSALLPWHKLDIRSNFPLAVKDKKRDDIAHLDLLWRDIRDSLFAENKQRTSIIKSTPSKHDIVLIRAIDISEDYDALYCEIDDEEFEGHGWLPISEIVKYMNGSDKFDSFFKDENGKPMLFEATVIREPDSNGEMEFSMLKIIQEYIESEYAPGDIIRCNIRKLGKDKQHYVCVSEFGSSCRVYFDPELGIEYQSGDIVEARIAAMNNYGQFECDYVCDSERTFSIVAAFKRLINNLGIPEENDETLTLTNETEEMSKDQIFEIICILDRMAVVAENKTHRFGFLALAGILSEMIADTFLVDYYDKRKQLMKIFHDYENNGTVDGDTLSSFIQGVDKDLVDSDYLMNESLTKLHILDSLKHKDNVDRLFDIRSQSHNNSIRNAADLAIALLLTNRFEIPNMQRQLEDRICRELGVTVRTSKLKDYGFETQTLEFKSSIIYPADNHMQPSPDYQGAVIMQTICGFLNSDAGGTLYLGVNKNGASCGVDEDMRYLGTDEDGYGRYVHGMINRELGQIANQCCIDCTWESDGGYRVYRMNIKPSPELIAFRGQYWIRQDTEKRPLASDKVDTYRKMHEAAYAKSHRP